ncbi:uncharacterized protein LOC127620831 [Xyrauchen texanus]|uniref:uncharacterized protein LOC127620831 n=1 Tax=Xyrauchen texanus TaxID=154827 RepID=UPI002242A8F5|nr:uncharacterized protein LOC127620831 [Xyrauchen texanus]
MKHRPKTRCCSDCPNCGKAVRINAKAVACDFCDAFVHIKCGNIASKIYELAVKSNSDIPLACNRCCMNEMCHANGTDCLEETMHCSGDSLVDARNDCEAVFSRKGLHFIHINARSLLPKLEEVSQLASTSKAAVIAVSETWLDGSIQDVEVELTGYSIYRHDRSRNGGGVCLFIRNDLTYNPRTDLHEKGLESAWIELLLPKTKPIIICVCYRPPKQTDFYELFEMFFCRSNVCMENECIIRPMGDFNTNVLQPRTNSLKESLSTICKVSGLQQLITEPTRVSVNSQTLLDLILVSERENISQSGVLDIALSDHNVTFCTRKISKSQLKTGNHSSIRYRCTKHYTTEDFKERLSRRDWSDVLGSNDVDGAWSLFKQHFLAALDNVAPMKETRIKQRSAIWMTSDILDLIRQRDKWFRKFKRSTLSCDYDKYIYFRNQTSYKVQKTKSEFYADAITANLHQPKKLWKVLSDMGVKEKSKSKSGNISLVIEDKRISDKQQVACVFNTFFTTVAASLFDKLQSVSGRYDPSFVNSFYINKHVTPDAFEIGPVSEERVRLCLSTLSTNKATGQDLIPSRFLSDSANVISRVLTHIINLSLSQGIFPSGMKRARVVPLFKKNSRSDVVIIGLYQFCQPYRRCLSVWCMSRWKSILSNKIYCMNFSRDLEQHTLLKPVLFIYVIILDKTLKESMWA